MSVNASWKWMRLAFGAHYFRHPDRGHTFVIYLGPLNIIVAQFDVPVVARVAVSA